MAGEGAWQRRIAEIAFKGDPRRRNPEPKLIVDAVRNANRVPCARLKSLLPGSAEEDFVPMFERKHKNGGTPAGI